MKLRRIVRYLMLLLILIMFFQVTSTVNAADVKGSIFTRDKYDYTITKVAKQNEMGFVTVKVNKLKQGSIKTAEIPQTVIYNNLVYRVKSVGKSAFYNCKSLTTVTIPNTVTSIGQLAFGKCSSLVSINIPDSVVSIGANSFTSGSSNLVISCSINSQAFTYVKKNNIKFKAVIEEDSSDANKYKKVIIIGDSRTNNMSKWVSTSVPTKFVAKSGQGYSWFVNDGINGVNSIKNAGDIIVVWLGVNDYFGASLGENSWTVYANKINDLVKNEWADCKVYVAAVGYVDRAKMIAYYGTSVRSNVTLINGYNINGIQEFNSKLKDSLTSKVTWIDTYNVIGINHNDTDVTPEDIWLTRANGLKDGLHYGKVKTQEIYNYFIESTILK